MLAASGVRGLITGAGGEWSEGADHWCPWRAECVGMVNGAREGGVAQAVMKPWCRP